MLGSGICAETTSWILPVSHLHTHMFDCNYVGVYTDLTIRLLFCINFSESKFLSLKLAFKH